MLLRLFRGIQPYVIFLIILITVGVWLDTLINPVDTRFFFNQHPMPLYDILINYVPPSSVWGTLITMIIWIIQGFLLVRLNTKFIFIIERTYLPAVIFVMAGCFIKDLQSLNPVIISNIFLIIALEKIIDSYRINKIYFKFFDAGFLLGIGTLFYLNVGFFLIIIWISLLILRTINWREWVLPVFGFITPALLTAAIYYLLYGDLSLFINIIRENLLAINFTITRFHFYFLGFIALITVFASFQIIRDLMRKKIRSRKIFKIFFWAFILTLIVFFAVPWASYEMIVFGFVPLSFLFTNYFLNIRIKWFGELSFFLFTGGLIFLLFVEKIL